MKKLCLEMRKACSNGYPTWYASSPRLSVLPENDRLAIQDKFGFCFVSGVPATPEATEEMVKKIGFIRETQCESVKLWRKTYLADVHYSRYRRKVLGVHS